MQHITLRKPLGISPGEWKVCETGIGPAVVAGPGEQGTKLVVSADGFSAQTKARRVADANLIAAAPLLLACVKRLLTSDGKGEAARAEARIAIDKAQGRLYR